MPVRLVGGEGAWEGRVEVQIRGEWGTVCDDDWDLKDANVLCRSLGFNNALEVTRAFGPGTGEIWLDNVQCQGSEDSIVKCRHNTVGNHNCRHSEDVGIRCNCESNNIMVNIYLMLFPCMKVTICSVYISLIAMCICC